MTDRKFYQTTIQVVVLSEEPDVELTRLATIAHNIVEGDWSGTTRLASAKELNGKQAARALLNQGSDPSFFNLTDKGEDADN